MTEPLRAELLKLRTTRTTLGILLSGLVIVALTTAIPRALADTETAPDISLWNEETQRAIFGSSVAATMFAAFAGLLLVTGEYRHGTIRPTFLFVPRRARIVVAKVAAAMLAGVVIAGASLTVSYGIALPWLDARGVPHYLTREELVEIVLGIVGACALWAAIGVGLGALVRNQVGGIIALIAWSLVESIVGGVVREVGRLTPGEAANALGGSQAAQLSPPAGLAVLCTWAAVFAAAGVVATLRRDVP